MARVLKGSHSFTCIPSVHPLTGWTMSLPSQPKLVLIYRPQRNGSWRMWYACLLARYRLVVVFAHSGGMTLARLTIRWCDCYKNAMQFFKSLVLQLYCTISSAAIKPTGPRRSRWEEFNVGLLNLTKASTFIYLKWKSYTRYTK